MINYMQGLRFLEDGQRSEGSHRQAYDCKLHSESELLTDLYVLSQLSWACLDFSAKDSTFLTSSACYRFI
jgi:hypothetical protein